MCLCAVFLSLVATCCLSAGPLHVQCTCTCMCINVHCMTAYVNECVFVNVYMQYVGLDIGSVGVGRVGLPQDEVSSGEAGGRLGNNLRDFTKYAISSSASLLNIFGGGGGG